MIVCLCMGVSDREIRTIAKDHTLDEITELTGACQQCKTCCETVAEIIKEEQLLSLTNKLN